MLLNLQHQKIIGMYLNYTLWSLRNCSLTVEPHINVNVVYQKKNLTLKYNKFIII